MTEAEYKPKVIIQKPRPKSKSSKKSENPGLKSLKKDIRPKSSQLYKMNPNYQYRPILNYDMRFKLLRPSNSI